MCKKKKKFDLKKCLMIQQSNYYIIKNGISNLVKGIQYFAHILMKYLK